MALYPAIAVDVPASAPPASAPTGPPPVLLVPPQGEAAETAPPGPPVDASDVFISYGHAEDHNKGFVWRAKGETYGPGSAPTAR